MADAGHMWEGGRCFWKALQTCLRVKRHMTLTRQMRNPERVPAIRRRVHSPSHRLSHMCPPCFTSFLPGWLVSQPAVPKEKNLTPWMTFTCFTKQISSDLVCQRAGKKGYHKLTPQCPGCVKPNSWQTPSSVSLPSPSTPVCRVKTLNAKAFKQRAGVLFLLICSMP